MLKRMGKSFSMALVLGLLSFPARGSDKADMYEDQAVLLAKGGGGNHGGGRR